MAGDFGYYSYFNRFGGIELSFKSIGMKSSMVEFSTDNKETLNKMAKNLIQKIIISYLISWKKNSGGNDYLLCHDGNKV